jgi:hypothetical protein
MDTVPALPTEKFSGERGWRNPGVTVSAVLAVTLVFELRLAVTVTWTLLAVR